MKVKVSYTEFSANVPRKVSKVYRVIPFGIPSGITSDIITQKGGLIAGTAAGSVVELPPGAPGQYLTGDPTSASGLKYETPSIAISDPTNFLINGGFHFAQRTTPGTLTAISDNAYSADRWKITRENADLQYQRNDATGETGLTSLYYGKYKKITNAGKFMLFQIIEGAASVSLRSKTVIFQAKMKASTAKTIRMAVIQLQTGGTIDTIPGTFVTAWNVDSTDPTIGTNLAVITGAESKSVTTAWQNFSVSVTIPSDAKNVICAIWSNADFSAGDELNIAEAGLFLGASLLSWTPRPIAEELQLCQRYYYKTYDNDIAPGTSGNDGVMSFLARTTNLLNGAYSFPVPMRTTTPTGTLYSYLGTANKVSTMAGADIGTTVTTVAYQKNVFVAIDSGAGFTAGTFYLFQLTVSAEL